MAAGLSAGGVEAPRKTRMNVKIGSAVLVLAGVAAFPLISQDWPMWGGAAQRNMASAMKNLPESWDVKSGKNIKWKAQIGSTSYGNPVVADGKIFLGTNNGNPRNPDIQGDRGVLMCFRESDGKFLWQAVTDKLASGPQNDFPEQGVCSSPAVEGKRLYYVSNRGELVCLDTEGFLDGKNDGPFQGEVYKGPSDADIVWKLDMMKELGVYQRNMANSSPVIWEDLVFVETSNGRSDEKLPSPKAPSFLAVNKNTGKVVWQDNSPGDGILQGQWSSPALGLVDGVQQAFFAGGDGWLYGFNARTGERLWKFDLNPKNTAPEDAQLRNLHACVQRRQGAHERGAGSRQRQRTRSCVQYRSRKTGRYHRIRQSLAVRQDQPIHFDSGSRQRVGFPVRF